MGDASGSARSSPARLPSGSDDQDGRRDRRSRGAAAGAGRSRHRAQASRAGGGFRDDSRPHRRPDRRRIDGAAPRRRRPRNGAATRSPDRRRSVVYLDPAPRAAFDTRDDLRAAHGSAQRDVRPARAGDCCRDDGRLPQQRQHLPQRLLALEGQSFDLGRYAAGRSKPVFFDEPGIVRVFCEIHSHMSAFILVFAHRYFAVTDEDGTLPSRQRSARHLHGQGLERDRPWRPAEAIDHNARRRRRRRRRFPGPMSALVLAHQPHLPGDGVSGRPLHRRRDCHRQRRRHAAGGRRAPAGLDEAAAWSPATDRSASSISRTKRALIADLPKLKAAVDTTIRRRSTDCQGLPERAQGGLLHHHAPRPVLARFWRSRGRRRGAAGHAVDRQRVVRP